MFSNALSRVGECTKLLLLRMIKKVEGLLVKCGKFRLPSNRQMYQPGWERKVMMVDVSEPGNRTPPKKQKR
jgi:hypothetical protein